MSEVKFVRIRGRIVPIRSTDGVGKGPAKSGRTKPSEGMQRLASTLGAAGIGTLIPIPVVGTVAGAAYGFGKHKSMSDTTKRNLGTFGIGNSASALGGAVGAIAGNRLIGSKAGVIAGGLAGFGAGIGLGYKYYQDMKYGKGKR